MMMHWHTNLAAKLALDTLVFEALTLFQDGVGTPRSMHRKMWIVCLTPPTT
jgi:hypothetical protein